MITGPYTLFTRIPVSLGPEGEVLTNPLWAKDLELHLDYIEPFRLCCPVLPPAAMPAETVPVRGLRAHQVTGLARDGGLGSVLRNLLPNFARVARAVRQSRVVHSGGAGWAFPLSFYILPLRLLKRFRWIVVIESSFWMKPAGQRASFRQWLTHHAHARLLRACLRRADVRIFTQDGYRQFFGIGKDRSLIAPAVWIDEGQILTEPEQQARIAALPRDEVRFLFPARMVRDKGPELVLEAIRHIETRRADAPGPRIVIDLIGAGPLAGTVRDFAAAHRGAVTVNFLDPVEYGTPFLSLLRRHHAILLANLQDEQPRVIFDAFSQGVPVIASATSGVRDVVTEEADALLYDVADARGLADRILRFAGDPDLRARLMEGALASVQGHSHVGMHRTRHAFLAGILEPGAGAAPSG